MADMVHRSPLRTLFSVGAWLAAFLSASMSVTARAEAPMDCYVKGDTWQATLLATREKLQPLAGEVFDAAFTSAWQRMEQDFPIPCDWLLQDLGKRAIDCFRGGDDRQCAQTLLENVGKELGDDANALKQQIAALQAEKPPLSDARWWNLYREAAEKRRAARLKTVLAESPRILFLKHYNLQGSHYAYTEAQSDGQAERNYRAKSALCALEMNGIYGTQKTLIDDPDGVIRDPDVSFDGKRVLFAWKRSDRMDDYHLHELELETLRTRQITHGLGFADYEGIYLSDGDILFNSTRCVQIVDCWWTEVSNLYACNQDGRQLRRLGFDQVHTNYPQMLDDGRITYTRWEYNDRGQIFPQPLYQMNADGTGQTEFYGNNSFFPTSILHARGIPGTQKVIAIASGHHSSQAGKLIVIDPSRGRQENEGVQLVAPLRETPNVRIDGFGQEGDVWMYPYAFNQREFLVTFCPEGLAPVHGRNWRFGVYYMDIDGRRELLASDPELPCCQAMPIKPRTAPVLRPTVIDYRKDSGTYYMQDVYAGPGLAGVPRGTVKSLRVVTIDFRAAGIGSNGNYGAMISTPIAIGNGAWDPKTVLGTTPIYDDGSAMFTVPARTPVYFQALDAEGQVVQTMRSWSTLQPGETNSCTGCHENKNQAPQTYKSDSLAMKRGPQPLAPFYGPPRGFSFAKEVQPILDKHCISCHDDRTQSKSIEAIDRASLPADRVVTLLPRETEWRYCDSPSPGGGWEREKFDDSQWATGKGTFGSGAPEHAFATTWESKDLWLRRLVDAPAGEYSGVLVDLRHLCDMELFINGVFALRSGGLLKDYELVSAVEKSGRLLKPGKNLIAVRLRRTEDGPFFDAAVLAMRTPAPAAGDSAKRQAFSLLGAATFDRGARRFWSDAYLQLTDAQGTGNRQREPFLSDPGRERVNWVSAQSAPPMLKPYSAGAAKSKMIAMLKEGHEGVKLSQEEMQKISCWIDLGVPFCGNYCEANAWTAEEREKYDRFVDKRGKMAEIEAKGVRELIAARTGDAKYASAEAAVELDVALIDAKGNTVAGVQHSATTHTPLKLELPRGFAAGDKLRVRGSKAVSVSLSPAIGEAAIFAPTGELEIALPENKSPYAPGTWDQPRPCITVRPYSSGEADAYRNVASNPYDAMGVSKVFPHASSNSECRSDPVFAARNAIDGRAENKGHGGWPFQSWGPEQIAEPWWQVDFGREVEIERVVIHLRADFPHDKHWHSGELKFSSGGSVGIHLEKTADAQVIRFHPRKTTFLRLGGLRQEEPLNWCAITEVEVYGRDAVPMAEDPAKPFVPE